MMMLQLPGTETLPEVAFNGSAGRLSVKGRCIPENALEFFAPLLSWLDAFKTNAPSQVVLDIYLEYFNSSSVSSIANLVRKVDGLRSQTRTVDLYWHYEADDEDMMDSGTDIIETFGVDMTLVPEQED